MKKQAPWLEMFALAASIVFAYGLVKFGLIILTFFKLGGLG